MPYDSQYRRINAGIHRRPPPQIAPPALTWHRGYWKPAIKPDATADERQFAEAQWHHEIDRILLRLFETICSDPKIHFACPNLEIEKGKRTLYLFNHKAVLGTGQEAKLEQLSPDERTVRHEVFSLRAPYEGIRLVVHARLRLEYFSILFAADFSRNPPTRGLSDEIQHMKADFERLQRLVIDRCKPSASNHSDELSNDQKELVTRYKKTIEETFTNWVDGLCEKAFGSDLNRDPSPTAKCGSIFADLLGVVFGVQHVRELTQAEESNNPESLLIETYMRPESDARPVSIRALVGGTSFAAISEDMIDAVLPVLKWRDPAYLEVEARQGKTEYSASLLEDGDALYLSSFGRFLPKPKEEPIVYYLFASYPSKRRLGRLIDQLHSLETLRLAALRDLSEINSASEAINELITRVTAKGADKANLSAFSEIGRKIDIGLTYRIDRARNYISSFRELLTTVRIEEVKGFPKYDEFVRRRLFDTYDYIDRVGARYEELRKQITFQLEAEQQQTTQALRTVTAEQTAAMAEHTKAMASQSAVTSENTKVTNDLLRTAEILSVAPVTYYVGRMLNEMVGDLLKLIKVSPTGLLSQSFPYFLVAFALASGISFGLNRARKRNALPPSGEH